MDFSIILMEWPTHWEGFYTTIWLVSVSLMLGLMLLAVAMGILRNSRNWLIKGPIWAFTSTSSRGTRRWCSFNSSSTWRRPVESG